MLPVLRSGARTGRRIRLGHLASHNCIGAQGAVQGGRGDAELGGDVAEGQPLGAEPSGRTEVDARARPAEPDAAASSSFEASPRALAKAG